MLSNQRRSIHPEIQDTWESIATRALPDQPAEQAVGALQSWNLHVFMRPAAPAGSPRAGNPILPSDVIFLEAPRAPAGDDRAPAGDDNRVPAGKEPAAAA